MKNSSEQHWSIIGALRFFLAFVVICNHLFYVVPFEKHLPLPLYWMRLFGGTAAVSSFFMVSGYSIAASISTETSGFYVRRFIRLGPVYYLCMILSLVPWLFSHGLISGIHNLCFRFPSPWIEAVSENLIGLPGATLRPWITFGVTWSLCCEIVYYALTPRFHKLPTKILLLIAALSLLTFTAIGGVYYSEWPTVLSVWPLLWWWLAGFLLWRYKGSLKASAIFAVAALFGVTTDHAYGELWSPVCIGITVAVLCCPEITRPVTARWLIAVGNWLGDISYPLYLCHLTIYFLLFRFLPTTWHSIAWVYVGIGLFSAITIRHLWETPAQRYLKSRWNSHGVVATLSEKHRVVQVVTTLTILCLFATNLCMPLYGGQVPVFPPNKAVHSTFSPITPPIKVMALGDSITYGDDEAQPINRAFVDCEGGYRPILWKALSERGYGIKPVGSVNVGSDMSYDWHCEAHPGATTADFLRCLDRWDSNIRTDVILYQLGTNDPGNGISTTETLHNTATLWQRFFLANPHVVLMVATVIPSRGEANPNHDRFAAINDGLRRQVGVWRQHGYNIYLVDMDRECGFTNDDLGIPVGLHPTPSGYRKMAVVWLHHITTAVPLTTLSKKAKTS